MLRRALPLLLAVVALAGCGDEAPHRAETKVAGNEVVKRLEAAMQKAGTGRSRTHDGNSEFAWNFAGVDRLLAISHSQRIEARQIGHVVYQRAQGNPLWVKLPLDRPVQPLPELTYFKGREATQVTVDGTVVAYVVDVPSKLLKGTVEPSGGPDELAVTIFVDGYGLPTRTEVEGNGLSGERFDDWGEKILIEKPDNVYKPPKGG